MAYLVIALHSILIPRRFVCATAKNSNIPVHFQNYVLPGEPDRRPATIVDAACATLSSVKVFEAVQFGRPPSKYVAGDLGANNPIDRVWNEAQRIWSKSGGLEQSISCRSGSCLWINRCTSELSLIEIIQHTETWSY